MHDQETSDVRKKMTYVDDEGDDTDDSELGHSVNWCGLRTIASVFDITWGTPMTFDTQVSIFFRDKSLVTKYTLALCENYHHCFTRETAHKYLNKLQVTAHCDNNWSTSEVLLLLLF